MKPIQPLRSLLLVLATSGAGCLFAALAFSGPNPSDQQEARPTDAALAVAAIRREVVDPLDAPLLKAVEREQNRRLFSRVAIPASENPPAAAPFHSIEILTVSNQAPRLLGGEIPAAPTRVPFRLHRVDPVAKTSQVVGTGYYDTLTEQVYLLDPEQGINVPRKEHPLLKGVVG